MVEEPVVTKRYYVYEIRSIDGQIGYVGMSLQPLKRLAQHRQQPWGKKIESITLYPVGSEAEAEELERVKIIEHQPPWNRDGVLASRPRSCRAEILDIIRRRGPSTATQIRNAMRSAGSTNGDQVSTIVNRLIAKGDLYVTAEQPRLGGYHETARVFALRR